MKHVIALAGLAASALVLTGCSSSNAVNDVSFGAITGNPTPELQNTSERPSDMDRNYAVARNVNRRGFWNDLGRAFYVDHPSWMSPYPITRTSGIPR